MKRLFKPNIVALFILIISIFLISFAFIKAALSGLTFDESFTYLNFVKVPLINNFVYFNANNHFLNSLLIRLATYVFGSSEIVIRLPNVLSFIPFLISSYYILKKIVTPVLLPLSFLIIVSNPYVLEFFTLARGYGISISFITCSIYFLIVIAQSLKPTLTQHFLCISFATLSVLSNLSTLNFFISICLVLFFVDFYKKFVTFKEKFEFKTFFDFLFNKTNLIIYVSWVILMAIFTLPIYLMKFKDQLYYGGTISFWEDTVKSLVRTSFYHKITDQGEFIIQWFILITILFSIFIFIWKFLKNKELVEIILLGLLLLTVLSTLLQNILLNGRYLVERTALFFIPLYFLVFIVLTNKIYLVSNKKIKKIIFYLTLLLTMFLFYNLNNNLSIKYTEEWSFDSNTKDAFYTSKPYLNSESIICTGRLFFPTLTYYTKEYSKNNVINLDEKKNEGFSTKCNIYYLDKYNLSITENLLLIKEYKDTETYLFLTK